MISTLRIALLLALASLQVHALAETTAPGDERTLVRRTTLIVADAEKSMDFYRDVLRYTRWYYSEGKVTAGSMPADAEIGDPSIFAIMKGKDPWIGMVGLLQKGPPRDIRIDAENFMVHPGDTILMMQTDDLDGIYQRMLAAGTPIWKHPQTTTVTGAGGKQWDATFLFAIDPDGHLLEINQPRFPAEPSAGIRRGYADTRSGQLHYRYSPERDGVPLLMLHQTPLSSRMYRNVLPLLAEDRQVLAPDTPGYGESERAGDSPSINDYSDSLVDWMDALGIQRADLFGYHTGSAVAADFAARYPDRVRSLVLMSVPLFSADEMQQWSLGELDPKPDGSHLLDMWNNTYNNRAPNQSLDMVATTVAEKQRAGRYESAALRALSNYSLEATLREVKQPVAFISPGDGLDQRTLKASQLVATTHFVGKPDWGYGIFDTEAEEIASLIDSFLTVHDE